MIYFRDPALSDALTDLVRDRAQRIIKQAVQAELVVATSALIRADQLPWQADESLWTRNNN